MSKLSLKAVVGVAAGTVALAAPLVAAGDEGDANESALAKAKATPAKSPATAPARTTSPEKIAADVLTSGHPVEQVSKAAADKKLAAAVKAQKQKKAATKAAARLGPKTGPSEWKGKKLRHPDGGTFPPEVLRWASLVSVVMKQHKIPQKYLPGILAQIQQESFGDPKAVNNWDVNAQNGDPSRGLLQVIGSTYEAHAKDGYQNRKYQTTPYTNIWAALNYVKAAYGMGKFSSWNGGANQGY